jgi:hypothetical protein
MGLHFRCLPLRLLVFRLQRCMYWCTGDVCVSHTSCTVGRGADGDVAMA